MPSRSHHSVSNLILATITTLLFPTALLALIYNYAALALIPPNSLRRRVRRSSRFKPQNVIITGVSTPAGLRVARALYQTGHNVIGIDIAGFALLCPARYSKAVSKFYVIRSSTTKQGPPAYIKDLLNIVLKEGPSLWIDCSDSELSSVQAQARRVIEQKSSCACLAADAAALKDISTRQNFDAFLKGLQLPTIEAHSVGSRHEVHGILNIADGKKYVLSSSNGSAISTQRAILPRRTLSQTYNDVSKLKISKGSPWVLEEYLGEHPKYTAFSVVTDGKVRAFAVRSQIGSKSDTELVPATSGLHQAMRTYIDDLLPHLDTTLSSPFCVDFCVAERATKSGVVQQILPLECRLAADATILLFTGWQGSINITQAYLSLLAVGANGIASYTGLPYHDSTKEISEPSPSQPGVFYFDEDVKLVVESFTKSVARQAGPLSIYNAIVDFLRHLGSWQEARYEFWDPLPAFWYYFVCVPIFNGAEMVGYAQQKGSKVYSNGMMKQQ